MDKTPTGTHIGIHNYRNEREGMLNYCSKALITFRKLDVTAGVSSSSNYFKYPGLAKLLIDSVSY